MISAERIREIQNEICGETGFCDRDDVLHIGQQIAAESDNARTEEIAAHLEKVWNAPGAKRIADKYIRALPIKASGV